MTESISLPKLKDHFPALNIIELKQIQPVIQSLLVQEELPDIYQATLESLSIKWIQKLGEEKALDAQLHQLYKLVNLNSVLSIIKDSSWLNHFLFHPPVSLSYQKLGSIHFPKLIVPLAKIHVFPKVSAYLEFPFVKNYTYLDFFNGIPEFSIPPLIRHFFIVTPSEPVLFKDPNPELAIIDILTSSVLIKTPVDSCCRLTEDPVLLVIKLIKLAVQKWLTVIMVPEKDESLFLREVQLFAYDFLVKNGIKANYIAFFRKQLIENNRECGFEEFDNGFKLIQQLNKPLK